MRIPGIPTTHDGVNFRSRLEAKWAKFFDLIGWKYEYEPFDLNGYIPDFVITNAIRPLLIEVKPAVREADLQPACHKIWESGWDGEAMVVGATMFRGKCYGPLLFGPLVSLGEEGGCGEDNAVFSGACVNEKGEKTGTLGFCAEYGSYACRICGFYDGNPSHKYIGEEGVRASEKDLVDRFKQAGNATQWKSRGGS